MSAVLKQRGAVLFVSLIVMVVLSIIAITAVRSSGLELLIANNTQFSTDALLRAEAGVTAAETYIQNNHPEGGPSFDFGAVTTDGLYLFGDVDPTTVDWSGFSHESLLDANGVENARFVIEYIGTIASAGGSLSASGATSVRHIYRITALGIAERDTTRLVTTIFATS